ncbi:MAG: hypothetical protein MI919_00145 [Holophagales bacterium]|nr:hypothetical protein [Holophagales bacterium]
MKSARRDVEVTGLGVISPLGDDPSTLFRALAAGESGIRPLTLFDHESLSLPMAGQVDLGVGDYFAGRNVRPVDRTGRLAIAAAGRALASSGLRPAAGAEPPPEGSEAYAGPEIGLVLGTMFGSIHTISAFDRRGLDAGPKYVKPLDFANSVINAAAGQTAIWHGLRGTNSTVAGGLVAGLQAIAQGVELVRHRRCEALLAGGAEELSFESFLGMQRAGLSAGSGDRGGEGGGKPASAGNPLGHLPQARPFDARRHGFLLAEGAALLVLEGAGEARRRGAEPLARVSGHGSAFDPSRGRDRQRAVVALERAIHQALDDAGLAPGEIDAVSAGADGSRAGDLVEGLALARVFHGGPPVPVTAVKSQLGEALGAGGAFQAMALVGAMLGGELPGIAGLGVVDPEIPTTSIGFSAEARALEIRRGLVTAVGLDGAVAALVIERAAPADAGGSPRAAGAAPETIPRASRG